MSVVSSRMMGGQNVDHLNLGRGSCPSISGQKLTMYHVQNIISLGGRIKNINGNLMDLDRGIHGNHEVGNAQGNLW